MRSWYREIKQFIIYPYAFFEERIGSGKIYPAQLCFALILALIGSGWCLVKQGGCSLPGPVLPGGILLPLFTYPAAVLTIYLVCHLLVRENQLRSFFAVWGFSYLPTSLIFAMNIIFHGLAADPWLRALLIQPWLQVILWTVILLIFLWKLLLLAITLRLAGNLNFWQIGLAGVLLAGAVAVYWVITFSLGWLRVPFI